MSGSPPLVNALTIDVEDYFQVSAFAPHIERGHWDHMPCRVERNVELLLALLRESGTKATFFTLGWIAERYPKLVTTITAEGHEIASHGYGHHRASEQSPEAFLSDIRLAKHVLEDVSGHEVKGYRAPSFSIGRSNPWAFDCLHRAGYRYSSSVYPVRHDHYGMPDAPRFSFESHPGLLELPVTTCRVFQAQPARRRRRLLPSHALQVLEMDDPPGQPDRQETRRLLLPSLGGRPRAAAGAGCRTQDPLPPLRKPASNGAAAASAPDRLSLGPGRPGISGTAMKHHQAETARRHRRLLHHFHSGTDPERSSALG